MTPENGKKAQNFFITLFIILGLIGAGYLGHLYGPSIDNFTQKSKAAIAVFDEKEPTKTGAAKTESSFVAIPTEKPVLNSNPVPKKQDKKPITKNVEKTTPASSSKFPKEITSELGWDKEIKEKRKNVFEVGELTFVKRSFTLNDPGLAKETCNQLIAGPTKEEWEKGCRSGINTTTKVLSIKIENKILYLGLSEKPSKTGKRQFRETLEKLEGVEKVELIYI